MIRHSNLVRHLSSSEKPLFDKVWPFLSFFFLRGGVSTLLIAVCFCGWDLLLCRFLWQIEEKLPFVFLEQHEN